MKKILVTGASGFIARAFVKSFFTKHKIIVLDNDTFFNKNRSIISIKGDIADNLLLKKICDTHAPDVVVHCAGIAHQKIGSLLDEKIYDDINHIATKTLAIVAAKSNPDVHFVFLSSISVYGQNNEVKEVCCDNPCHPITAYAASKLNAEDGLQILFKDNRIKRLDILRLAPVYDSTCSLNVEKRVFGPRKLFYVRYGSGKQKMSILSRKNLIDFIDYRIHNNQTQKFCNIFNVTDVTPISFNKIIKIFKISKYQPDRRVFNVPLWFVWLVIRIAGFLIKRKRKLIHLFYDKLANDLIFDNKRMLDTGFKPKHSLKSIFLKE